MWCFAVAFAQEPPPPADPVEPGVVLLWHGFRHDWQRHAALGLHVPHRVSLFESRVGEATHTRGADGWTTEATFHFAQSTGVDGDFLYPEGYVGRLVSPDLVVHTGVEVLRAEASRVEGEHPKALDRFHEVLSLPKPEGPLSAIAVLQGLSFRSWCVEEDTTCTSDGIWPYRFEVELQPCQDLGDTLACPLSVEVGRAWTPARGGIRGLEEKPVEPLMGLEVKVAWAVLTAPPAAMLTLPWVYENALPSTREMTLTPQTASLSGLPTGYPTAEIAFTGLAFEFFPSSRRESRQERGRYIGGWSAAVEVESWDPATGELAVRHSGGLWLPRTVKRTAVSIEVGTALLLLSHPESVASPVVTARGALCSPSHGAPWFSAWSRCAPIVGEEERVRQEVPITIPP